MVAVGEDAAARAAKPVDPARKAARQPAHSSAEALLVGRFDDEMNVIALKRVVHDP